jgi:hypothetical protein
MPCGTWTIRDIPEAEVGGVVAAFNLEDPLPNSVDSTDQGDGKWTVTAVFADCPPGQSNHTSKVHGED